MLIAQKQAQGSTAAESLTEKMSRVVELGDGWGKAGSGKKDGGGERRGKRAHDVEEGGTDEDEGFIDQLAQRKGSNSEDGKPTNKGKSGVVAIKDVRKGAKADAKTTSKIGFQAGVLPQALEVAVGGASAWD